MAKKKMTMKQFERSAADRAADKAGKHGKAGSAKDIREDRKMRAKMNKGRK